METINIRTSYFSKYKENNGISIAISSPKWFKGEIYAPLQPTWEMVSKYKNKTISRNEYIELYDEILSLLNINKIIRDINNKVLLCWEKKGIFCHRRLVARWIKYKTNIEILEI